MFRTEIHLSPSDWKINTASRIFSMGSCFAIHIGELLERFKFDALTNPFGTIFNPLSIFQIIQYSLDERFPDEWTFIKNQGVYRNYLFHSEISSTNKSELTGKIEQSLAKTNNFLGKTEVVLLTFGTAIVYHLKQNDQLVANCHKVPAREFRKSFLNSDQIVDSFEKVYSLLKKEKPNLKFILTVSPVRHIKDSLELNSLSKSILRVACGEISQKFQDVDYFPSFELVLDDLRDYRFYKEDMLHPNDQAIKYVWNKFTETYFDNSTLTFISEWSDLLKSIYHKPFNPGSPEHQNFIQKTILKLDKFKSVKDVSKELEYLKAQLHD